MTDKTSTTGSSLHRKIAEIVAEISGINKTGTAPDVMGGYAFVEGSRVLTVIREALTKRNLTMLLVGLHGDRFESVSNGKPNVTADLFGTWRITDADTGESVEVCSFGAGKDSGDKYSGKAMASMTKYAVLTAFLLPTGADVESYVDPDVAADPPQDVKPRATRTRKATPEAVAAMTTQIAPGLPPKPEFALATDAKKALAWARSHEIGLTEQQFKALCRFRTKKDHSADWTSTDVDDIVAFLNSPAVEMFKNATFPEPEKAGAAA